METLLIAVVTAFGLIVGGTLPVLIGTSRRTKEMHSELTPNGGASIKDSISRIEARIGRIEAWNDQHELRDTIFQEYVHKKLLLREEQSP